MRGIIEAVQNNTAIINIGSGAGVQEADIFKVFDPTAIGGRKKTIGRIRVIGGALDEKSAECEILAGLNLSEGLKVEGVMDYGD